MIGQSFNLRHICYHSRSQATPYCTEETSRYYTLDNVYSVMIGIFLVSEQVNLNNVFVRNHVIVDQYCMCTTLY